MRLGLRQYGLLGGSVMALAHAAGFGGGQAFAQTSASPGEEDVIVVIGRAQELYRVGESSTGKLPAEPLDTPIVITTINADLIRDQGARDAQDIYRNIAGVSLFSYAGVTARGFRQEEIFFDGLRGDPYAGFAVPQLFNVERVDFLKGPAGMLYGPGAPGGVFNYVTKKPSQDFSANLRGIVGTEARYGLSGEVTGSLPIDGLSGRAGMFYEDRNTPRKNTTSKTVIYDLGLSADLGFANLTLQGTTYDQRLDGNRLRGVPVDDDGNFLTDRRWNHNEPDDFLDLISNNLQAKLEGHLGDTITWDATLRYTDSEENQEYHEPRSPIDTDDDGVVDFISVREFRDQTRAEEQLSFGANAIWSQSFGDVDNRLLTGVEHYDLEAVFDYDRARGTGDNVQGLSIVDPVYGLSNRSTYILTNLADGRVTEQRRTGVYLLNEATVGKFTLVGGVRFDTFEDVEASGEEDDDNVSYRIGGIYKPVPNVSLFAQWADSYIPQSISNQRSEVGGPFDPTTGTIVEGGVKAELFHEKLFVSLSVYDIVRENFLQTLLDENGDDVEIGGFTQFGQLGEVTSTGVELELIADITSDWVLLASYAYNDARITEDNGTGGFRNSVGDKFANAPENQFGFWTRYQVPAINTAFAIGGDYVDERLSLSGQTVKDYFTVDASVIWEKEPFEVLLRVDNLFDEEYAESGFLSRTGHFPGDPRSIFVEFSREW